MRAEPANLCFLLLSVGKGAVTDRGALTIQGR